MQQTLNPLSGHMSPIRTLVDLPPTLWSQVALHLPYLPIVLLLEHLFQTRSLFLPLTAVGASCLAFFLQHPHIINMSISLIWTQIVTIVSVVSTLHFLRNPIPLKHLFHLLLLTTSLVTLLLLELSLIFLSDPLLQAPNNQEPSPFISLLFGVLTYLT